MEKVLKDVLDDRVIARAIMDAKAAYNDLRVARVRARSEYDRMLNAFKDARIEADRIDRWCASCEGCDQQYDLCEMLRARAEECLVRFDKLSIELSKAEANYSLALYRSQIDNRVAHMIL